MAACEGVMKASLDHIVLLMSEYGPNWKNLELASLVRLGASFAVTIPQAAIQPEHESIAASHPSNVCYLGDYGSELLVLLSSVY